MYCLNYFIETDSEALVKLIEFNEKNLFKDFRKKKAPKDFLGMIMNKINNNTEMRLKIIYLMIEMYGSNLEDSIQLIISLIKTENFEEADKLIAKNDIEHKRPATFYYINGLKTDSKYGETTLSAVEWYLKAFELDKKNRSIVKRLVAYYLKRKNAERVTDIYEECMRQPKPSKDLQYDYAVYLYHSKCHDKATDIFKKLFLEWKRYKKLEDYCEALGIIEPRNE